MHDAGKWNGYCDLGEFKIRTLNTDPKYGFKVLVFGVNAGVIACVPTPPCAGAKLPQWVEDDVHVPPDAPRRDVSDIASLLSGYTVAVLGDSLTQQWLAAVECEAKRMGCAVHPKP